MTQFEKLFVQNGLRTSHLDWLHNDKRNEENIGNPKYEEFMYPEEEPGGPDLIKERPLASLFNLDDRPEEEREEEKSRRYIEKRLRSESFYFYSEAWRFLSKQIAFMARPKIECDNSDVYFAGRSIPMPDYDGTTIPGTEHFCARRFSIFNRFEESRTPLETIAEKILAAKKAFERMQFVRHQNLVKIHNVHKMFLPASDKDEKFGLGFKPPYKLIIVEEPYFFDLTDFVRSFGTGKNKAINTDDTRRIIFQLATGLDYMHRKLLKTHNNLSPKNVVFSMKGNFKSSIFKLTNFAWSQSIPKKDLNSVNPRKGDLNHLIEIARFLLLGVQNSQRCVSIQEKIGGWTAILPIENVFPQDFNRFIHRCYCASKPIEIITDEYMIGIRGQEYNLDCVEKASPKTKNDILLRFKLEKRYIEGLLSSQPAYLLADEFIRLTEHPDSEPTDGTAPNQYRLDMIGLEKLRPKNLLRLEDDGSLFYQFPKQGLYIQQNAANLVKYDEPADYFSCCYFTGAGITQYYRIKRISVYNQKRWDKIKKLGFDQINKEMKKWINILDREMIYNLLIQRHPSPNLLRVHWVLPIYFHETKSDQPGYKMQKPYQVLLFQDYHFGPILELSERFGGLRNEDIRKFAFQLTCAVRHLHELFKLSHGTINSETVKFVIRPENGELKIQFKLADWKPPPMSIGVYNSLNDAAKEAQEKGDSYWMIKASEIDSGLYQRSVFQIMYQPPMEDDSKIDRRRLDIYAIGCLVAEMNMRKKDPNRMTKSEEAKSEEALEARKEIADLISKSQFNQLVEKGLEPRVVNFVKKACDLDFKKTVTCFDLLSDPFLAKNGQEPHLGLSQGYLRIDEVENSAEEKVKLYQEVDQQLAELEETRKWYLKATKK